MLEERSRMAAEEIRSAEMEIERVKAVKVERSFKIKSGKSVHDEPLFHEMLTKRLVEE